MRGFGKGFGTEGGFTRNEGGGGVHEAPRYHCKALVLWKMGWVMSGMCNFGWMVGWKGAMPKSSYHRGLARGQVKGKREWSGGAPAERSCRHTMLHGGGGGYT